MDVDWMDLSCQSATPDAGILFVDTKITTIQATNNLEDSIQGSEEKGRKMPRSPRKKTTESSTKSTSSRRQKVIEEDQEHVTTPLSDATNLHQKPPATTPRHIDFTAPLKDEEIKDEWASDSDDSF